MVLIDGGYYDCTTDEELFDSVWIDFYDSTGGVGKLSIEVRIFNSLSYFYILKRLLRVDFAFNEDLLFNTS